MKRIYLKIWSRAKPYYKKGRPMDIGHVEWMMRDAMRVCKCESIDDSLLLPLVILHDIGYAKVPKKNPFRLDIRKSHMKEGAKIAKEILDKLGYPREKTEKIAYYISVHDNWAFGDDKIYKVDKILAVFNDLDYLWMATSPGFRAVMKILNKNPNEMIEFLESNEKIIRRPFSIATTKMLYEKNLKARRKDVHHKAE